MTDLLFCPQGVEFRPVSKKLTGIRLVAATLALLPFIAAPLVALHWLPDWYWWGLAISGGFVLAWLWLLWLLPRQVRALGWAVTETELIIRRGVMFRSMTTVPFGRIQYVDVEEGPLARMFRLAEVKLHTASAQTDSTIPGMVKSDATWLRGELTRLGEAHLEGL